MNTQSNNTNVSAQSPAAASNSATTTTSNPLPVPTITLPPPNAVIPPVPADFAGTNLSDYRGVMPKKAELALLPGAITDLQNFAGFTQVFGKTVPPEATTVQILDAARQWSSMRVASTAWLLYCATQEGLLWKDVRALFAVMKPAFKLAAAADATVAQQLPSFASLLGVAQAIAQRSVATRKTNEQLVKEGKPPTAGKVGKKRAKAAAKAAVTATPPAPAPAATATTPVATVHTVVSAATSATPTLQPATATATANNGASH